MAKHPEHQHHQHTHHTTEEYEFPDTPAMDKFPPIYTKDWFDPRWSHWPYASAQYTPPSRFGRIVSWTLGVVIVAIILAGLISTIASSIGH